MTIAERVDDGILLLDLRGPEGWREKVVTNQDVFCIRSACGCVLGITYGDFVKGTFELGINSFQAVDLGFEASDAIRETDVFDDEYDELQQEWDRRIESWKNSPGVWPYYC